jgi:hypothetical protein
MAACSPIEGASELPGSPQRSAERACDLSSITASQLTVMDTPVGEHIRRLENRLLELNVRFMENNVDLAGRNRIEADIRAAHLAIAHYEAALKAEHKLTSR